MTDGDAVHGVAVSIASEQGGVGAERRGLLILGPSGAGKSALALDLMAHGASLIVDDLVMIHEASGVPVLSGLDGAAPYIEARGIGLVPAPLGGPAPLRLVIDLGIKESGRLPALRRWNWRGHSIPLLARPEYLQAAAVFAALRFGVVDPDDTLARPVQANQGS